MSVNTAIQRPPRGAALRANKDAATAHAAAAEIRGLNAPFEQGVSDPPHPPRLMGKCNCRRGENGLDAEQLGKYLGDDLDLVHRALRVPDVL